MRLLHGLCASLALLLAFPSVRAADAQKLEERLAQVGERVVEWRRDLHQYPELGNQETRTAGIVAEHLRSLGMEPRTGIAHTGVAALLRGGKPGPRIAMRADMDALPVTEDTGLPFASRVQTMYRGNPVGVMHACGHDAHTAILMGVAELLAGMREELAGEVMFVFQPAEEGPPEPGQIVGARLMIDEGLFADFQPEAIYGLHVWASLHAGKVGYRSGPTMASADEWVLRIEGRQAHGSRPWDGIDPINVAAQIQLASQGLVARETDIVASPVVLTTGSIQGGVRFNIIPDHVLMSGTLRSFDPGVRARVIERFATMASSIAAAHGAEASLSVNNNAPLTANDAALAQRSGELLRVALGADRVVQMPLLTVAEDFSQFATVAPSFFFFVGATTPGLDLRQVPGNHSPRFLLDEQALDVGLRSMVGLALDRLRR